MGRGINSGASKLDRATRRIRRSRSAGVPTRGISNLYSLPQRVEWIQRGLCRESSLHEERDADDGRTMA